MGAKNTKSDLMLLYFLSVTEWIYRQARKYTRCKGNAEFHHLANQHSTGPTSCPKQPVRDGGIKRKPGGWLLESGFTVHLVTRQDHAWMSMRRPSRTRTVLRTNIRTDQQLCLDITTEPSGKHQITNGVSRIPEPRNKEDIPSSWWKPLETLAPIFP